MQAIITKHLSFTNKRPARIKAICSRGSITITEDSCREEAHIMAAKKLIEKFIAEDERAAGVAAGKIGIKGASKWSTEFVTGQLPNMDYCHVMVCREKIINEFFNQALK